MTKPGLLELVRGWKPLASPKLSWGAGSALSRLAIKRVRFIYSSAGSEISPLPVCPAGQGGAVRSPAQSAELSRNRAAPSGVPNPAAAGAPATDPATEPQTPRYRRLTDRARGERLPSLSTPPKNAVSLSGGIRRGHRSIAMVFCNIFAFHRPRRAVLRGDVTWRHVAELYLGFIWSSYAIF